MSASIRPSAKVMVCAVPAAEVETSQGQKDGFGKALLGVVPVAEMDKMKKPFPTRILMVPHSAAKLTEQNV